MRCDECGQPVGRGRGGFCGRCGAPFDGAARASDRSRWTVPLGIALGLLVAVIGVTAVVGGLDREDLPDAPDAPDASGDVPDAAFGATAPWEWHVGGFHHRRLVGVAVRDGRVYAADSAALYAMDAADGTILWRHGGDAGIHAGPALVGRAVIATTRDGLVAVDAEGGETVWRTRTGDARAWDHLATSPELAAAAGQRGTPGGLVGTVGVFDTTSGEQRWTVDLDGWVTTPLVMHHGVVAVATHQSGRVGRVEGFDAAAGDPLWDAQVAGAARLLANGDALYAASDREVVAIGATDGAVRWRTEVAPSAGGAGPPPHLAVVDGDLRVLLAGPRPSLLTLDVVDGDVLRQEELAALAGDGLPMAAATDEPDVVVGVSWDDRGVGTVRALDLGGDTVWEQGLDEPLGRDLHPTTSRVGADDAHVWVGTAEGSLVALSLTDGSVAWRSALPPPVGWQRATTTDGHLVLVDVGNNLIALRGSDGDLRWTVEEMDAPGTRVFGPHGSVLVGSRLRRIIELDPASGDVAAEIEIEPRGAIRTLAASDRYVLAGTTSGVHGVDPVHRRQRWVLETDVPIEDVVGGRDHVAAVDEDGRLLLLDGSDGELRREVDVEACTPPVIVGDTVVVGTARGLRAFDTVEGTERWTIAASRPSCVPLALAGDLVHVTDLVRTVSALDPEDGSEVWATELDELVTTPPAAGPQHVAVGTASGTVLLDVADGSEAGVVTSPAYPVAVPVLLRDGLLTLGADGVVRVVPLD